jgi:bla regulator protein blaR1
MIPPYLMPLANHLWQSTLFAGLLGLMTLVLRNHRASLRYWLWLAASIKFLLPFSLMIGFASHLALRTAPADAPAHVSTLMREINEPFVLPPPAPFLSRVAGAPSPIPEVLFAIWLCGFAVAASRWLHEWIRVRSAVRRASPMQLGSPFLEVPALMEPCVFGIFRPLLLLPDGIQSCLTPDQLEAIFRHERCHVRRRDNLTAAVHMVVETVFWFFPLVHWIGTRLMDERERACDEEVLGQIAEPAAYAEGILAVCRFGLRSSPACAAGVAGCDLKKRIEGIMGSRTAVKLGFGRKLLIVLAFTVALANPLIVGVLSERPSLAQAQSAGTQGFAVASIKSNRTEAPNSGFRRFTGGKLDATNVTLRTLISFAYDISQDQILQGPAWLDSERYDVLAKPDRSSESETSGGSMAEIRFRTQKLLADRFKLTLHKESRELPIFALVVDKGGPKNLQPPKGSSPDLVTNGHLVTCQAASMGMFAKVFLMGRVHTVVLDRTGIQGQFDFSMDWTPDDLWARRPGDPNEEHASPDPAGPSLFVALREQLGLRLEATRGPVDMLVVDHAERPSEN